MTKSNTMQRVPYEFENKGNDNSIPCKKCGAAAGDFHVPGCGDEICPRCGDLLHDCMCKVLSPVDELRVVQGISERISKEMVQFLTMYGSENLDASYLEKGAFQYIVQDVLKRDPDFIKEVEATLEEMGAKKTKDGFSLTPEQLSKKSGISIGEAEELLQELRANSICPGWESNCIATPQ